MKTINGDDSLLVDISDALSERDRVRFTVHTRTKLPQFAKPVLSVVRQHEEFIWLHDCLEENDQYAGYIIPPPPPRPDFDASREKLQRLGDGESSMSKDEFAKMKQELEAEYLAIFKKTVAMHEIFLQRLAAHEKFRQDNNFKIFLEYENELAVRCKSAKEKLAGSIQNIGKSLTDFVITTSQVAANTSASTSSLLANSQSPNRILKRSTSSNFNQAPNNCNIKSSDTIDKIDTIAEGSGTNLQISQQPSQTTIGDFGQQQSTYPQNDTNNNRNKENADDDIDEIDERYFERERLFLALYYNSIKEAAIQADRVCQVQRCLADSYLNFSQNLVRLASVEVLPITAQTKDSSGFVSCPLPSLTLPLPQSASSSSALVSKQSPKIEATLEIGSQSKPEHELAIGGPSSPSSVTLAAGTSNICNNADKTPSDKSTLLTIDTSANNSDNHTFKDTLTGGCANNHTSEGLKKLLLRVSDYLDQARKIEARISSDEDLKITDSFLYYKRETAAAQDLLARRLKFMAEYDTAIRNSEKARQKGRTQMQYAEVIQKQAKENFVSISKLARQELIDYKQRRVLAFRKAFTDLVELELKHLRNYSQLTSDCLEFFRR